MKHYYKEFYNWQCTDDDRVSITCIESSGSTVDELLDNAMVSFEDWHGNCIRDGWTVYDLSQKDISEIETMFKEFLLDVPNDAN